VFWFRVVACIVYFSLFLTKEAKILRDVGLNQTSIPVKRTGTCRFSCEKQGLPNFSARRKVGREFSKTTYLPGLAVNEFLSLTPLKIVQKVRCLSFFAAATVCAATDVEATMAPTASTSPGPGGRPAFLGDLRVD
jgi:hypothetical protein